MYSRGKGTRNYNVKLRLFIYLFVIIIISFFLGGGGGEFCCRNVSTVFS